MIEEKQGILSLPLTAREIENLSKDIYGKPKITRATLNKWRKERGLKAVYLGGGEKQDRLGYYAEDINNLLKQLRGKNE